MTPNAVYNLYANGRGQSYHPHLETNLGRRKCYVKQCELDNNGDNQVEYVIMNGLSYMSVVFKLNRQKFLHQQLQSRRSHLCTTSCGCILIESCTTSCGCILIESCTTSCGSILIESVCPWFLSPYINTLSSSL